MKRAKIVILIFLIAAAIALAFLLWPRRTDMDLTFHAMRMGADGTLCNPCTLEVDVVYVDYLYKKGHYEDIVVQAPGYRVTSQSRTDGKVYAHTFPDAAVDYISLFDSYLRPTSLFLEKDGNWCILQIALSNDEKVAFVGAVDPNADLEQICKQWGYLVQ